MVSLVATGSKRVAEKFSPQKNKQHKVDFKPDGANKENMPEVSTYFSHDDVDHLVMW
jgi:hypothetical protein